MEGVEIEERTVSRIKCKSSRNEKYGEKYGTRKIIQGSPQGVH